MEVRTYFLFIRHQLVAVRRQKAEQHKIVRISPFYTHTKLTERTYATLSSAKPFNTCTRVEWVTYILWRSADLSPNRKAISKCFIAYSQ